MRIPSLLFFFIYISLFRLFHSLCRRSRVSHIKCHCAFAVRCCLDTKHTHTCMHGCPSISFGERTAFHAYTWYVYILIVYIYMHEYATCLQLDGLFWLESKYSIIFFLRNGFNTADTLPDGKLSEFPNRKFVRACFFGRRFVGVNMKWGRRELE